MVVRYSRLVIRNERSQFVKGKNVCFKESVSVLEAEARGVQLAIDWTEELGLQQVDIESDAEVVVKAVKNEAYYYSEVGHILDYCRMKIRSREDLSLYHVKRQANIAAFMLARAPCLLNCFNVFVSPPNMLLETLLADIS